MMAAEVFHGVSPAFYRFSNTARDNIASPRDSASQGTMPPAILPLLSRYRKEVILYQAYSPLARR